MFLIPAGTEVSIAPVGSSAWKAHTTRRDLSFSKYENKDGRYGAYLFHHEGWRILVANKKVKVVRAEETPALSRRHQRKGR